MIKLLSLPGNQKQLVDWLENYQPVEVVSTSYIQKSKLNHNDIFCLPGGNNFSVFANSREAIKRLLDNKTKCIFICGSFQLLFSSSDENDNVSGLNMYDYKVENLGYFNIGFQKVYSSNTSFTASLYFNHRYGIKKKRNDIRLEDGDIYFTESGIVSAIVTKHIFGTQFHPEISHGAFDKVFSSWLTEK